MIKLSCMSADNVMISYKNISALTGSVNEWQLLYQFFSVLKYFITSLLVPGDLGRLRTPIYVVTFEILRPMEARSTSCVELLWKPPSSG